MAAKKVETAPSDSAVPSQISRSPEKQRFESPRENASSFISEVTTPTIETPSVDLGRDQDTGISSSSPSTVEKPTELSSRSNLVMDDHMILWIVVASIGAMQILENVSRIAANEFPFSFVLAAMLFAFTAGLEMDANAVISKVKTTLLGMEEDVPTKTATFGEADNILMLSAQELHAGEVTRPSNPLTRLLRRGNQSIRRTIPPVTVLRRRKSEVNRDSAANDQKKHFNVNLLQRLQRFRSRKSRSEEFKKERDETIEPALVTGSDDDPAQTHISHHLGAADINKAHADVLSKKLPVKPMCELRGMDVFLADISEAELSNHPFLVKNGLREVPTFVLNMMTQWGNVLIYMQLPDWVVDFGPSIVESQDDPNDVKALKRFLSGPDEYRRARMKLMPEITEAPYAVRLLAPKGSEITLEKPNFLATSYRLHDVAGKLLPIMECTLDFMGNSTMRGMASLVKRYLSSISIDFALVIGTPDEQKEKEPECILGLSRMHHIDVTQYPSLPDRFETEGCSEETVDSIRASLLVKTAEMHSSRAVAPVAT